MPKTQYGPTYGFTEGKEKNSFVPKSPVYSVDPIVCGPVLIAQTGSGKYAPMPLPKVGSELMMSGPVFPIPDHYSKYSTQSFGCSGSGLKVEKPTDLYGPGNRDVGSRNSAMIEAGKYVPEIKEIPHAAVLMTGPKMPGIVAENKYNVVPDRVPTAAARMEMPGPVYPDVISENKYSKVEEKVKGELFHPLPLHPGVSSKNCYSPQVEPQPGQLVMAGPKFKGVNDQVKFTPNIKKVDTESLLTMNGPKFRNIVDTSLYNESPAKSPLDGTRLMTTPIYPGIKAENSFGTASMGY